MQATKKSNSDPSTTSCLSLVSLSCLQCECSAICQGKTQPNVTHRVFHHIDITSVAFLILSDLFALGGAQANASSIYRRLPVNPSASAPKSDNQPFGRHSHRVHSAIAINAQTGPFFPTHHSQQFVPHVTFVLPRVHGWWWRRWRPCGTLCGAPLLAFILHALR